MEPRPNPKILVVDDSKTSIFVESALLRRGHYQVITANDGREAVDKALSEKPDLILMDVVMPRMTGVEACRELKRHDTTRGIPVILVTTKGEGDDVETGFRSGCSDYVTKPVDGLELLAKVRSFLS